MYEVTLLSFLPPSHHQVERILQKHGNALGSAAPDRAQREKILDEVVAGRPQVIARYAEHEVAARAAVEWARLGAGVRVAAADAGAA